MIELSILSLQARDSVRRYGLETLRNTIGKVRRSSLFRHERGLIHSDNVKQLHLGWMITTREIE